MSATPSIYKIYVFISSGDFINCNIDKFRFYNTFSMVLVDKFSSIPKTETNNTGFSIIAFLIS